MDRPLVTIVIPNYNLAPFVGEAIGSALAQTYPRIEIIVVDDGSTDDSRARIAAFPGVTLLARENGGVARARNLGAERAKGDYLVFLDADDVLDPTYVEKCLAALAGAPAKVAYAYTQMVLFGTEEGLFEFIPFDPDVLLDRNFVHCSALVRRSAFEAAGGWNPAFHRGREDHELWVRMLAHGYHGVLVPEPLLRYRRHGASRNTLGDRELRRLQTMLMLSQPRLYWKRMLKRPLHTLRGVLALRFDPL